MKKTRSKIKYGEDFYNKHKAFFLKGILNRVTVAQMAEILNIEPKTLGNIFTRYSVKPVSIRHAHSKGQEVTL